ncbi:uncharacterized protein LY89DRAFT_311363 [Mollisia scopiformis]|uniref:2EXR domain-containing protein n=1 Tax=Mollisia scopiformis TaxID=149040 RepID=A0A194XRP0_MOLSC|nr:uncharacterized protein LY89DRAFT_311363 [Mollisia scopiformis]KUJ22816.1 hypothetical protein LY89DRAFT_311363 [Mollisia scopiformis]
MSMTAEQTTTTSFTCFPRLPPELRQKIWRFALPTSRIVQVYGNVRPYLPRFEVLGRGKGHPEPLAVLAHTCRESYHVMRESYDLLFQHQTKHGIYFNSENDILYIHDRYAQMLFVERNKSKNDQHYLEKHAVRYLAFGRCMWGRYCDRDTLWSYVPYYHIGLLESLTGLKHIAFIANGSQDLRGLTASGLFQEIRARMRDCANSRLPRLPLPVNYDFPTEDLKLELLQDVTDFQKSILDS